MNFNIVTPIDLMRAEQQLAAHREQLTSLKNQRAIDWTKSIITDLEAAITTAKVKANIKAMAVYNIDTLNTMAMNSGLPLITLNFWFNATHS